MNGGGVMQDTRHNYRLHGDNMQDTFCPELDPAYDKFHVEQQPDTKALDAMMSFIEESEAINRVHASKGSAAPE